MSMIETVALTLLTAISCAVACCRFNSQKNAELSLKPKANAYLYWSLVILAIVIAAGVRIYRFGQYPIGMNQDGAMGATDALALSQYGTDRFGMRLPVHLTAWGFGQMSALLSYITVPFIWLCGGLSVTVARMPMLVCSLLGVLVLFLFCRRIAGNAIALVTLLFAAINPWHIMQSRWALDCNLLPHFFLFSVYFLHLGLDRKIFLYISMVFFGLTMYTYGIAFYAVPVFLVCACAYLLIKKHVSWKQVFLCVAVYAFVAWPIFAVMIINFFHLPSIETPLITIPFFPDTQRLSDIIFFSENIISQFRQNVLSLISIAVLQSEDLPWNNIPQIGSMYLFASPFLLMGIYRLIVRLCEKSPDSYIKKSDIKEKNSNAGQNSGTAHNNNATQNNSLKDGLILLVIWLLTSVVSGCVINGVNINRINIIFYPLIILFSLGIHFVISRVRIMKIPMVLILTFGFLSFCTFYFETQPVQFYPGFGEALADAENTAYERIYVTTTTQSENSYWTTEILTQFYHQLDAEYLQGKRVLYDENGNELLPYGERYNFIYLPSTDIVPAENIVYIAPLSQLYLFPESEYDVHIFRDFAAVYPR